MIWFSVFSYSCRGRWHGDDNYKNSIIMYQGMLLGMTLNQWMHRWGNERGNRSLNFAASKHLIWFEGRQHLLTCLFKFIVFLIFYFFIWFNTLLSYCFHSNFHCMAIILGLYNVFYCFHSWFWLKQCNHYDPPEASRHFNFAYNLVRFFRSCWCSKHV